VFKLFSEKTYMGYSIGAPTTIKGQPRIPPILFTDDDFTSIDPTYGHDVS